MHHYIPCPNCNHQLHLSASLDRSSKVGSAQSPAVFIDGESGLERRPWLKAKCTKCKTKYRYSIKFSITAEVSKIVEDGVDHQARMRWPK